MSYNSTDLGHLFGFPVATTTQTSSTSPRLRIVAHNFSPAQKKYQEARDAGSEVFYKDATPRVEHHLKVTLAADNVAFPLPIRIHMCLAEDGTEVSSQDQQTLRILGDGRKQYTVPAGGTVSFSYRFELGSFRRADQKFCLKISADAREGLSLAHVAAVAPALTPGVLVLSKKKLEPDHPSYEAEQLCKKRKLDDLGEGGGSSDDKVLDKILDRLTSLEQTVAKLADALHQGEASSALPPNGVTRDHSRAQSPERESASPERESARDAHAAAMIQVARSGVAALQYAVANQ